MATIKDLKFDDKNFNKHTEFGMSLLEKSLRENGAGRSILLDKDNNIIAGNGIVEAAGQIGLEKVKIVEAKGDEIIAVKRTDISLNSHKGREMALADNATAAVDLDWDDEAIKSEFTEEETKGWGVDLDWKDVEEITEDEAPEVNDIEPADSELGKVYKLGEHRLMCGDSTDAATVAILMDGQKADMVFTDPPYVISVVGSSGNIGGDTKFAKTRRYKEVIGDDEDFEPSFILKTFEQSKIMLWGANYFSSKLPDSGKWLVWDKNRGEGTTFSDCELCWTNLDGIAVKKYKCTWDGMRREGESGERFHPTQKPIKLCSDIIRDYSEEEDIVADLFGGSGSTLIACEQLGRKCYMMELDPKYCDVIRKRYWKFKTGSEEGWQEGTKAVA